MRTQSQSGWRARKGCPKLSSQHKTEEEETMARRRRRVRETQVGERSECPASNDEAHRWGIVREEFRGAYKVARCRSCGTERTVPEVVVKWGRGKGSQRGTSR